MLPIAKNPAAFPARGTGACPRDVGDLGRDRYEETFGPQLFYFTIKTTPAFVQRRGVHCLRGKKKATPNVFIEK